MNKETNDRTQIVRLNFDRIIEEKGLKQKEVAEKMSMTPQTLSGHLKKRNISDETISRMAEALEVAPKELLVSEAENKRISLNRQREDYYRTTWRGRLVALGCGVLLFYMMYFYANTVTSTFAILSMLLLMENIGFFDPVAGKKPTLFDRIAKIVIRIIEIICLLIVIVYPMAERLSQ